MSLSPSVRNAALHLTAATVAAICGLTWRMVPLGLPTWWLKYGGSAIWGAMVLFIVGAIVPRTAPVWTAPALASIIALASELFRLVHAPSLDAFRLTLAGALLIGRIYNPWNVLAYAVGIGAAMPLAWALRRLDLPG